jgi:hypothetical protein
MATNIDGIKAALENPGFTSLVKSEVLATSKLFASGLGILRPDLAASLRAGAPQFGVRYWKPLDDTAYMPTTDNANPQTARQRLTAAAQSGARRLITLKPVDVTDLESHLVGEDLTTVAKSLLADAMARRLYKEAVSFALAVAGFDTDGVTAGTQAGLTVDVGTGFNFEDYVTAVKTQWGDSGSASGNVIMGNSMDFIAIRQAQGTAGGIVTPNTVNPAFETWAGNTIVENDDIPQGTVLVFKRGAFGFAYGSSPYIKEVEVQRDALADMGGGMDTIVQRAVHAMHIDGISLKASAPMTANGFYVTAAQMNDAANWEVVAAPKNIPFFVMNIA